MKKSYKIVYGYGKFDYLPISVQELPKAYYAFKQHSNLITQSGDAIRGKDIMRIEYNWRKNIGHSEELNWQEVQKVERIKESYCDIKNWAIGIADKSIEEKNTSILSDYDGIKQSYLENVKESKLLLQDKN